MPGSIFDSVPNGTDVPGSPTSFNIFASVPDGPPVYPNLQTVGSTAPDSTAAMIGKSLLSEFDTSILIPFNRVQDNIANYLMHPEDQQTHTAGTVTENDAASAKLLGAPSRKVGTPWTGVLTHQTDNRTPEEIQRDTAIASGKTWAGPIEYNLLHGSLKSLIQSIYEPAVSTTEEYNKVKSISHLIEMTKNPSAYPKDQVEKAQEVIKQLQEDQKKSIFTKTSETIKDTIKHPLSLLSGLEDLPMYAAPELKLGDAAFAAKEAEVAAVTAKATQAAELASKVSKMASTSPELAAGASAKAKQLAEAAMQAKKELAAITLKRKAANLVGSTAAGAGINTAASALQQTADQGYVQKGSLGAQAITGSIFGALLGGTPKEVKDPVRPHPDGTGPGAPLPADTPINTKNHVGYVGGTDATTPHAAPGESLHDQSRGIIHYSKEMPTEGEFTDMQGNKVTVPVAKTVAYHESVEAPLMHLKGPVAPEQLKLIRQRMGPYDYMEPGVEEKLQKGESLTYAEAHDIATRSENHMVEQTYGVDPKEYQAFFKPWVKKVAEANKTASPSEIPANLDTKPYDNMGHPEVNKGQGSRPSQDAGQKGSTQQKLVDVHGNEISAAGEKPDATNPQKSIIHNLAKKAGLDDATYRNVLEKETGKKSAKDLTKKEAGKVITALKKYGKQNALPAAVLGAGAAAGYYNADQGKKGQGMLAGASTAMILGARALSHDLGSAHSAEVMEAAGKTPGQIQEATGYHRGADGQWLHEISDRSANLNEEAIKNTEKTGQAIPLREAIRHSRLASAYPELMDKIKVKMDTNLPAYGQYDPRTHTITLNHLDFLNDGEESAKSVLLHEIMHGVQHHEGLPFGTSPERYIREGKQLRKQTKEMVAHLNEKAKTAMSQGDMGRVAELARRAKVFEERLNGKLSPKAIRENAELMYKHSAGENQSRDVQARMDMTSDELRRSYVHASRKDATPLGRQKVEYATGKKGVGAATFSKILPKQEGKVTFDQAKRLAFLGLGGLAGYTYGQKDHKILDTIYGSVAGILAGAVSLAGIGKVIRDMKSADNNSRLASHTLDKLSGDSAVASRHITAMVAALKEGQGDNSLDIAHSIEGDTSVKLDPQQELLKKGVLAIYKQVAAMAKAAGMDFLELLKYTTHIFAPTEENEILLDQYNKQQAQPFSKTSRFTQKRVGPPTLRKALDMGLTLKHDNFADTFAEYVNSMTTAIHTKVAVDALQAMKDSAGRKLLIGSSIAPRGYIASSHPALKGLSIHPAIHAEMMHLFDVHNPTHLGMLLQQANGAVKRLWFADSFFHAHSLFDVQSGMSLNPATNFLADFKALAGTTEFQKAINNPEELWSVGNPAKDDVVDKVLRYGGKVSIRGGGFTEDLGTDPKPLYDFMTEQLNKTIPGLGNLTKGAKILDVALVKVTFDRIATGLSGISNQVAHDKLQRSAIWKSQKDPNYVMPPDEEFWKQASSFSNVSFGSLNWRALANEVSNKYLRQFLLSTFSPAGRRSMQAVLVAPEWLVATSAHWTKALLGKGSSLEGLIHPQNAVDLHRGWLIKSTISYLLYANALNYIRTGHGIEKNKDPFMVDLGDGRKMQLSKELTDFPRLLQHPAQETLNKLSPLLKIAGQQVMGTKYLSASGYAPRMKTAGDRAQNMFQSLSPISASNVGQGGATSIFSNILGTPIYGKEPMTQEEKMDAMRKRYEEYLKEKGEQ